MTDGGDAGAARERLLHELRTPLSVIKGSIEVLRRHDEDLDRERRGVLLERALSNVEELAAVIDALDPAPRSRRARLEQVELVRTGAGLEAKVTLQVNGELQKGRGRSGGAGLPSAAAAVEATLSALGPNVADGVVVEEVDVVSCGEEQVAAVVLSRHGRRLAGSALADLDHAGSLCRATLQALNRELGS
jgi:signal transduction histidine kinase